MTMRIQRLPLLFQSIPLLCTDHNYGNEFFQRNYNNNPNTNVNIPKLSFLHQQLEVCMMQGSQNMSQRIAVNDKKKLLVGGHKRKLFINE